MRILIALAATAVLATAASAQKRADNPAAGLSSLLGSGLPKVGTASAGNAAGLLGYCVKNKLVGGADATSVLGKLTGKPGVTSAPGYTAGQSGVLQTGSGTLFSLDSVKGQVKSRVCDMVLRRATSFL